MKKLQTCPFCGRKIGDSDVVVTNFDDVARSKETLAAFIAGMMQDACRGCPANFCDKHKAHCEAAILQWLSEKVR